MFYTGWFRGLPKLKGTFTMHQTLRLVQNKASWPCSFSAQSRKIERSCPSLGRLTPGNFSCLLSSSCVLWKVAQCDILPCSQPWLFCCKVSSTISNTTMQRIFQTLRRVKHFLRELMLQRSMESGNENFFHWERNKLQWKRSGATHLVMYN